MRYFSILFAIAAGVTTLAGCQTLSDVSRGAPKNVSSQPQIFDMTPATQADKPAGKMSTADNGLKVMAASGLEEKAPGEPVVTANEATTEYSDLWARIRGGFKLSHELHRKRVMNELKWFVNHPEYVERVARRAEPHLHYIVEEIEKRGLPMEFALLPVVESAFDPFAYSHGRAAGLWQFIPSTARVYGLKIDWWYDGRRDVRTSTTAAIDYLEYLHNMFKGDWLLALASYNAGQGNVLSSIRASKLPRAEADFWSIKVLRETHTYVPRLLAISELIAHPERYHMKLPPIANEPQWAVAAIGSQLDLNRAAELAGMSAEALYLLNPGFNQWATHPEGPHELLVPLENYASFTAALKELPASERVAWVRHKIKNGESLGSIASKYRTTIETIRHANGISGNVIRAGHSILIPSASDDNEYAMSAAGRLANRQASLEKVYGVEPIVYIVKTGDSLWKIARSYGVGMRELARWNGMGTTGMLRAGTKLKVFKSDNSPKLTAVAPGEKLRKEKVRKVNYRVRKGESLSLIASKFNVSVQSIRSWNETLNRQKYIHPGDRLTLYVDVTSLIN